MQSSGNSSVAPQQPSAMSSSSQEPKICVVKTGVREPPIASGYGLSAARSFDWFSEEEEGPLEVEGSELVTSPDVMIPIKSAKTKRKGAQGQRGGGECRQSRSPQQKGTLSEVSFSKCLSLESLGTVPEFWNIYFRCIRRVVTCICGVSAFQWHSEAILTGGSDLSCL